MSDFFSFLKSTRAKVGLVDFYDLSEIYESSQKDALRNLFLDPDALDQVYTLSRDNVSKEDIRTAGGLDRSVINSIALSYEVLPGVSTDILKQIRTDTSIGEPSKLSFSSDSFSDNLVVFHGGIAANNIEYNFLDENGEVKTTTVPTSRESLFNSVKDNQARITLASYPSLFRVRRRSHVSSIRLRDSMLLKREAIVESPTDLVMLPVYMHTSDTTDPDVTPLRCYATKNSPITIPVKITSYGSFSVKRSAANSITQSPFVFGWELRRASDQLLVLSEVGPTLQGQEYITAFSVVGTLAQDVSCDLVIYLDPLQVEELNLRALGIKERSAQDLGLIGFDNLKKLKIGENGLTTLPVWLKTLDKKLEQLDISQNPHWFNGIIGVFDYQDLRGSGIEGASQEAPPSITATQVLTYSSYFPNGARNSTYTGEYSTVSDDAGKLYKDLRKNTLDNVTPVNFSEAQGFRTFSRLKELLVGASVPFVNADFSKAFPNLENFQAATTETTPQVLRGLLPKFNNNDQPITVNYWYQKNLGGTINYMGNTLQWTDTINASPTSATAKQFIGQFKVKSFLAYETKIKGGFFTGPDDVNSVAGRFHVQSQANVAQAWSGWLDNLTEMVIGPDSQGCCKIANGTSLNWKNLAYISSNSSFGSSPEKRVVVYNANVPASSEVSDDILVANTLYQANLYASGIYGRLFSIKSAPMLQLLQVGGNDLEGYGDGEFKYLLPSNFVDPSAPSSLLWFIAPYIHNPFGKSLIFRQDDFKYLPKLNHIQLQQSQILGKFPTIYDGPTTFNYIDITLCAFRDLSSLAASNRISTILFSGQSVARGGALLPNFTSSSNNVLEAVEAENNLSSYYPEYWFDTNKANKAIESLINGDVEENEIPGVVWNRDEDDPERIFADRTVFLHQFIMTGDQIYYNDVLVGEVTQLDRLGAYIYARGSGIISIPTTPVQLVFRRKGQNVSSYFNRYTNLKRVLFNNNRLVGSVPKFEGCNKMVRVDLSDNLLTSYQLGTFGTECLLGGSGTINLDFKLNNNPLSKDSIRKIITDLYTFASNTTGRTYSISVNLRSTKWNSDTTSFVDWQRSDVFTESITRTVPDPTPTDPGRTRTETISDVCETYFNRMGTGTAYPNIKINLFGV